MTKKIKILLGLILIIAVVAVIIVFYQPQPQNNSFDQSVKIGLIGHFSGEYASYSLPLKNAAQLAVEEFNNSSLGFKVELVIEDDASDASKAASAITKLINVDGINYILSAQGSGATSVVAPIVQGNQKILMITLGSAPGLTQSGDFIFRTVPSDTYQAAGIVEFINNKLKSKKVAGLYVNEAYGQGIKNIINQNKQVEITNNEMFEPGASDYKTQLLKIKAKNPDTLVLVARANEYPIILKQIKEIDLDVKIIASETFKDEQVLADSGNLAQGVYVTFQADPIDYVDFHQKYKDKYNQEPSAYSMYAYDGTWVLIKAIEENNNISDGQRLLFEIKFPGASGNVSFDDNGDRLGIKYIYYVFRDGEFVKLQ